MTPFYTVLLCFYVADLASFLASNGVLGTILYFENSLFVQLWKKNIYISEFVLLPHSYYTTTQYPFNVGFVSCLILQSSYSCCVMLSDFLSCLDFPSLLLSWLVSPVPDQPPVYLAHVFSAFCVVSMSVSAACVESCLVPARVPHIWSFTLFFLYSSLLFIPSFSWLGPFFCCYYNRILASAACVSAVKDPGGTRNPAVSLKDASLASVSPALSPHPLFLDLSINTAVCVCGTLVVNSGK